MTIAIALVIAALLTVGMFVARERMLGFPCGIAWFIAGGLCYVSSAADWDMDFISAFSWFFMGVFAIYASFGLRTKTEELDIGDEYIDEGKDDLKFIDEGGKSNGKGESDIDADGDKPRRSARGIRERADKRRTRWD